MGRKHESAKLILELFDLRREQKTREARDWFMRFNPKSDEEVMGTVMGHDGAKLRMVAGYWDMTAALVNHGAIDKDMFFDTNGEFKFVFAKLQPFLPALRKAQPDFLANLEKLVMKMPNANKQMEDLRIMMESWSKSSQ